MFCPNMPGIGCQFIFSISPKVELTLLTKVLASKNIWAKSDHLGLTPRRFQSGEVDNPGRISRAGDPDVRSALYLAAHALVTRSEEWSSLKVWGIRLIKTKGRKRAVIAVARKLAVILHRMWLDGTDFRYGSTKAMT